MRTIKSYVLRAGRISVRQRQGLEKWLKDYRPPEEGVWSFEKLFGQPADTILEIGFGMGGSLLATALAHPHINYLGIEVHQAGLGSLAADLHDQGLTNVLLVPQDAVEVLENNIPDNSLAGIQIFFPDPWPKKRHHKRRLIQPTFVKLVTAKLKPGGFLHCATDSEEYANHMLQVLSDESSLMNQHPESGFIKRPDTRPETKFEKRGIALGHTVSDLLFCKKCH